MSKLCIYHGNCADGFGAAWVVREYFEEDVDFHAGVYGQPPPDVTDKDVWIVDFSYPIEVLWELARKASRVTILDHHKTAQEDLARLIWAGKQIGDRVEATQQGYVQNHTSDIAATFDMARSGAGLAWDYFFPEQDRPRLIDHIEDRDLWRFDLPNTRFIQAAVFSIPYKFELWDSWFRTDDLSQLVTDGEAIERKHHKDVAELIQVVTRMMTFKTPNGFRTVPIANLPYTMTSDAGHLLCGDVDVDTVFGVAKYPFAGCYWDTPDGRVFSLRSREDGSDVGAIAKIYGGGGHKHASGFTVSFDDLQQFFVQGGN